MWEKHPSTLPPSHEEVKVIIMRFNSNKAAGPDGFPA